MPEAEKQPAPEVKSPAADAAPAGAAAAPAAAAQGEASAGAKPCRGKVLLADDITLMRNLLARALRNAGYTVTEARNGGEVLELVGGTRPDLIVMDNMMPVMSGPECLRRLKAAADTCDIPVIMCTAKTEKKDVLDAARGGAVDYIVKPFKIETVLERVAKHMPPGAAPYGA